MTKYAFTFLNLLFIGAIVYTGVSGFYLFTEANIASLEPSAVDNTRISVSQTQRRQPLSHYNPISERNLFKTQTDNDNTPVAVNVETLEQTSLNLKLWGTVTGTDKEAFAVIEEAGNRQQNLYRIGDTVENATVKMILREKVVLSVNGKDEVLEIEKAVGGAGDCNICPAPVRRDDYPERAVANRDPGLDFDVVARGNNRNIAAVAVHHVNIIPVGGGGDSLRPVTNLDGFHQCVAF